MELYRSMRLGMRATPTVYLPIVLRTAIIKVAEDDALTTKIQLDNRIHDRPEDIEKALARKTSEEKRAILEPYAEYQRLMDKMWPERRVRELV